MYYHSAEFNYYIYICLDGTYDVSYIVSRDKDREVPAVFISVPEEGSSRAVKPRCRWCKSFVADCRHNQEYDEEAEARALAEAERAARELEFTATESASIPQLVTSSRPSSQGPSAEIRKRTPAALKEFYDKADKDRRRSRLNLKYYE